MYNQSVIQYISIYIQAERVRQKILSFFFWGGAAWSYAPAPKKQKPSHSISGSYNLQKKGEKKTGLRLCCRDWANCDEEKNNNKNKKRHAADSIENTQ